MNGQSEMGAEFYLILMRIATLGNFVHIAAAVVADVYRAAFAP